MVKMVKNTMLFMGKSWVNQLFRLGHFLCRKVSTFTRGYHGTGWGSDHGNLWNQRISMLFRQKKGLLM